MKNTTATQSNEFVCVNPSCKGFQTKMPGFAFTPKGGILWCPDCDKVAEAADGEKIAVTPPSTPEREQVVITKADLEAEFNKVDEQLAAESAPVVGDLGEFQDNGTAPASEEAINDEVAELLKNAGLKREDIENWSTEPEAETAPAAQDPAKVILEEPDPKLVEYVDNIRVSGALPEYPVEFITKAIKGSLTKREVDAIVGEIRMNISLGEIEEKAYSIVVTDASQKDLMKQARELRLLLRQERLRIDHNAMAVKEPYLRKCQVIDPVRKHITDQFKAVETHLKDQEDFIKRQEQKIAEERRVARWEELAALEFQGLAELHGLGDMTDAGYEAIRSSAKNAYDLRKAEEARQENERILREERAQRLASRQKTLSGMGFNYGLGGFAFGDILFPNGILEEGTDETFQAEVARLTPEIEFAKKADSEKRARQDREATRRNELRRLGMVFTENDERGDLYRYQTEHGTAEVYVKTLELATEEDWTTLVGATTQAIAEIDDKGQRYNNRIGKLQSIGLSYVEQTDAYIYPDSPEINMDMTAVKSLPADAFKTAVEKITERIVAHQAEQRAARISDSAIGITGTDKEKLEALANQFEMIILPEVDNATAKAIIEQVEKFQTGIVTVLRQGAERVI